MTAGNQFYITHCTIADSVLDNPGYSVRAASTVDPDLLAAAFQYPPYELPIDLWKELPSLAAVPRRLARIKHAAGVWTVHSAYLEKDAANRDRSYFSHLILLPAATPAEVLRSWGASGWVKSYPPGAAKVLGEVGKLPVGKLVNDAAVTAFLGEKPTGPTELCVTVCPARLRGSKEDRRAVFARMLHALILRATDENEQRRRLFIHAEPGLVALLLYGAVRLLPPSVTNDLTFSTFEPYHRDIREFKLADVVGTYLASPDKGLDAELGTERGIALDTFSKAHSSSELREEVWDALPSGVSDLIDLAAAGEWKLLPAVRQTVGRDVSGLSRATMAIAAARSKEVESSKTPALTSISDNTYPPLPPEPGEPSNPVVVTVEDWEANPVLPPTQAGTKLEQAPLTESEPSAVPEVRGNRSAYRARKARRRLLSQLSVFAFLLLATGGVIAATIKYWPHPKPASIEVARSDPASPPNPTPPRPDPPAKDPGRPSVIEPPKPAPVDPVIPPVTIPAKPMDPPLPPVPTQPKAEPPSAQPRPGQVFEWEVAPGVKMAFCWIPPGRAQLGAPQAEHVALARIMPGGKRQVWMDAESARFRPNYTTSGFWLGKFEVTQAEWTAVMGKNPSIFNGTNANAAKGIDTSRFPVETVNWHDCQAFVKNLNERATLAGFGTHVQIALPHEDEWEYACRGGLGNNRPFYFGGVLDGRQANVDGTVPWGAPGKGTKIGRTTTVGSYEKDFPHPWGLCDMHGNVEEWCENIYTLGEDSRVLRGGHWTAPAWGCRSANRFRANPGIRGAGLRVCIRPVAGTAPGKAPAVSIALAPMPHSVPDLKGGIQPSSIENDPPQEVSRLIAQLKDRDEAVRLKAAKELGKLKEKAAGALDQLSKVSENDPDEDVRVVARNALASIRDAASAEIKDKAVEPMLKALRSKKVADRVEALNQLAKLEEQGRAATAAIVTAAMDPAIKVREAAASCLEKVDPTIHKHVVAILYDEKMKTSLCRRSR